MSLSLKGHEDEEKLCYLLLPRSHLRRCLLRLHRHRSRLYSSPRPQRHPQGFSRDTKSRDDAEAEYLAPEIDISHIPDFCVVLFRFMRFVPGTMVLLLVHPPYYVVYGLP